LSAIRAAVSASSTCWRDAADALEFQQGEVVGRLRALGGVAELRRRDGRRAARGHVELVGRGCVARGQLGLAPVEWPEAELALSHLNGGFLRFETRERKRQACFAIVHGEERRAARDALPWLGEDVFDPDRFIRGDGDL
jgi:hypothetical protein